MTTVDTNVVVRFLVRDDPDQAQRARALFADEDRALLVLTSVLLEAEWVLRSAYEFTPEDTAGALRRLLGLPNVYAEEPWRAHDALAWHREGLDFADALHLAGSRKANALKTFDHRFASAADGRGPCSVELL